MSKSAHVQMNLSPTAESNVLILCDAFAATYSVNFGLPLSNQSRVGFAAFRPQYFEAGPDGSPDIKKWFTKTDRLLKPRVLLLTRYAHPSGDLILQLARAHGLKVIYHIDDNLLAVPPNLGKATQERHNNPEVMALRRKLIGEADLIYTSTPFLADTLRKEFPSDRFFNGLFAHYVPPLKESFASNVTSRVFGYMGSTGHKADLALAVPAIARCLRENPDLEFETFGSVGMPDELKSEFPERTRHTRPTGHYMEFISQLSAMNWSFGLAPLVVNEFALCKTGIKFLEYTSAGIATLATDCEVYRDLCSGGRGFLVSGDDWYGALQSMINSPELRGEAVGKARVWCAREFDINRLRSQLYDLLIN